MSTVKTAVLISGLVLSISVLIGWLFTGVQVVDLFQSVSSGDIEESVSAIKNFTETLVRNEVNKTVSSIYLIIALELAAIFGSVAIAILALLKR